MSEHFPRPTAEELRKALSLPCLTAVGSPSRIYQPFLVLLYYRFRESMALLEYWLLGR